MILCFIILIEAVLSIYWSDTVFKPISKMIAKEIYKLLFWIMFLIRAGILIYFDYKYPENIYIALADFIGFLACAFIIRPLIAYLTYTIYDINDDQVISLGDRKNKVIGKNTNLRDRYSLGGSEHNGTNNDGDYSNRITLSNHSKEGVYLNRETKSSVKDICTFCGEEMDSIYIYCPYCGHPNVSKMIQDTDGFK